MMSSRLARHLQIIKNFSYQIIVVIDWSSLQIHIIILNMPIAALCIINKKVSWHILFFFPSMFNTWAEFLKIDKRKT